MAATSSVAPTAAPAGASTPAAEVKGPQTTFVLITPDGYMSKDDIKRRFKEEKFTIVRERTARLTLKQAEALLADYKTHADAAAFTGLANFITTNQVVALEIRADNAVAAVKTVGAQLTELYGTPAKPYHIALYVSSSEEAASKELDTIFQSTFAMIKPDAYPRREEIKARLTGEGFNIVREVSFTLTKDAANMFYAEHAEKKWFPDFANFMTSGPVLAMELNQVTAVASWRALCGPTSTEQAQKEAPTSLRAKFGTAGNPNANAVHGSDSAESARRELDLVFNWFQSNTYAMVKPDASARVEEIKKRIIDAGFEIVQEREIKCLPTDTVQQFYAEHAEKKWFPEFAAFMTSGPVVGFELKATNAIKRWRALCGPTSVETAVKDAPESLRAKFGTLGNSNKNAVHGSDSPDAARREIDLIFQDTFAMVKPDAVAAGHVDAIKARIAADGFEIVRSLNLRLNKDQAAQFYAEHKDRAWFPDFSAFMTSGEVHIMQLRRTNAVRAWRALCGPTSVKTALKDAPNSLRALYGNPENANANAVHGSDAATSAQREIQLMFEEFAGPKKPKGMVATADVESADPMDFL